MCEPALWPSDMGFVQCLSPVTSTREFNVDHETFSTRVDLRIKAKLLIFDVKDSHARAHIHTHIHGVSTKVIYVFNYQDFDGNEKDTIDVICYIIICNVKSIRIECQQ